MNSSEVDEADSIVAAASHLTCCPPTFVSPPPVLWTLDRVCVTGFASFPASDSQPPVPRPMSVNPFTVSAALWNQGKGRREWSLFSPAHSCLSGECLPQSRDVKKSFHLTLPPPTHPPSVAHSSISGKRGRAELEELPFLCLWSLFTPRWELLTPPPLFSHFFSPSLSMFTCLWRQRMDEIHVCVRPPTPPNPPAVNMFKGVCVPVNATTSGLCGSQE